MESPAFTPFLSDTEYVSGGRPCRRDKSVKNKGNVYENRTKFVYLHCKCGSSSVGRASASQAEGRGFESRFPLESPGACKIFAGTFFIDMPPNRESRISDSEREKQQRNGRVRCSSGKEAAVGTGAAKGCVLMLLVCRTKSRASLRRCSPKLKERKRPYGDPNNSYLCFMKFVQR